MIRGHNRFFMRLQTIHYLDSCSLYVSCIYVHMILNKHQFLLIHLAYLLLEDNFDRKKSCHMMIMPWNAKKGRGGFKMFFNMSLKNKLMFIFYIKFTSLSFSSIHSMLLIS